MVTPLLNCTWSGVAHSVNDSRGNISSGKHTAEFLYLCQLFQANFVLNLEFFAEICVKLHYFVTSLPL